MKMKRFLKIAYCVLFIALLFLPVYSMPLKAKVTGDETEPPALTDENGVNGNFPSETDAYLADNFTFRGALIDALAGIEASVFSASPEEQVIVGKDGWLYFSETLGDYTGENRFSDREINELARTLELINEYVTGRGAKFLFFSAPNKNTVYPEHMPRRYPRGDKNTNLYRLTRRLGEEPWYLPLVPLLENNEKQLYYKRDTHWNDRGALIVYNAVMERLGLPAVDFAAGGETVSNTAHGDLDGMLFPNSEHFDEHIGYNYDYGYKFVSRVRSMLDMHITSGNDGAAGSLLMFRDSFSNALIPFFAESFKKCEFTRAMPYDLTVLEGGEYGAAVIEMVERNLDNITSSAPVMPAPRRESVDGAEETAPVTLKAEEEHEMLHIYGVLPVKEAARVYLTDGESVFEAFPVYEEERLGAPRGKNETGFSAYLPSGAEAGNIKVYYAER